jgi:hypothetical protein
VKSIIVNTFGGFSLNGVEPGVEILQKNDLEDQK